jgi:hypothetical protein
MDGGGGKGSGRSAGKNINRGKYTISQRINGEKYTKDK